MTPEQFCYWLLGYLTMTNPPKMERSEIDFMWRLLNTVVTLWPPEEPKTELAKKSRWTLKKS